MPVSFTGAELMSAQSPLSTITGWDIGGLSSVELSIWSLKVGANCAGWCVWMLGSETTKPRCVSENRADAVWASQTYARSLLATLILYQIHWQRRQSTSTATLRSGDTS